MLRPRGVKAGTTSNFRSTPKPTWTGRSSPSWPGACPGKVPAPTTGQRRTSTPA